MVRAVATAAVFVQLTYAKWFCAGLPPELDTLYWRHVGSAGRLKVLANFRLGMHGLQIQRGSRFQAGHAWCRSDTEFWEDLSKFSAAAAFIKLRRSISEA